MKVLSQNARRFRLLYVMRPIDTVQITCTYRTSLGQDMCCGVARPCTP